MKYDFPKKYKLRAIGHDSKDVMRSESDDLQLLEGIRDFLDEWDRDDIMEMQITTTSVVG